MLSELYLKNNLKEFRIGVGLSQKELAELVGVTQTTISEIERGECNPSVKLAAILCVAVGCSFEELFILTSKL